MYALRRQNWIGLFLLIETQNKDKSTLVVFFLFFFFQGGIVKCFTVYGPSGKGLFPLSHRDSRERLLNYLARDQIVRVN